MRRFIINETKVTYRPGWDCHGLPIELKAVKSGTNLTELEIRQKARNYALQTIQKQKEQFKDWGVVANWSDSSEMYRTLDVNYVKNQIQIFYQLFKSGFVYRDVKPVYWSPSSK